MERLIGGVLGLLAFAAAALGSLSSGASFGIAAGRACAALVLGYWIGKLVFGSLGASTVREAAGPVPPPLSSTAPVEGKPAAPVAPSKTA
jgi:hypothetical protein